MILKFAKMGAKKDQVKNCPENGLKTLVETLVETCGVLPSHSTVLWELNSSCGDLSRGKQLS